MDDADGKQHFSLKKLVVPQHESKTQRKKRLKREAEAKKQGLQQQDNFKVRSTALVWLIPACYPCVDVSSGKA